METVVVTGATGGIGNAVCAAFARRGDHVVAGARDRNHIEDARESWTVADATIEWVVADARDEYDVERLLETAARNGDGVDVVVPCAAVNHDSDDETTLAATSYAAFDDTFRTNARGVFTIVREATPHLNDGARILVPTCPSADPQSSGGGVYGLSKAASTAIAEQFGTELSAAVAVVDPGVVATSLTDATGRDPADVAALFVDAADRDPDALDGARIDHRSTRP